MKTMNRLIHFVLLTVLGGSFALCQNLPEPDNKPWNISDYRARTLRTIPAVRLPTSQPAAEITFRKMRVGRPPFVYLYFDVVVRNEQNSARWFLLPSNLGSGHGAIAEKGGVDTLAVFSPRGKGRIVVGRFLGTGGFNALLLAPHAKVHLKLFPISYWGDPPANLQLEIVIANQLTIGGQKAEEWFGKSPMSSVKVDIAEDAGDVRRMRTAKRTSDHKEVPPQIQEDRRLTVEVALERQKE